VGNSNDDYPVFGSGPPRRTPAGGSKLGVVILSVIGAFAVVLFVGVKVVDCAKSEDRPATRERTAVPPPACDKAGVAARRQWIRTSSREFDDASPFDNGYRVGGACSRNLEAKGLSCDADTVVSVERDSPFLKAASALGFTIFVCIDVSSGARTEYSITGLVGR
jgi:hypothetical protein